MIDGASTDGTLEKLEASRDKISSLVSEPDDGIYSALNRGIALATGEVVGFLHGDDYYVSSDCLTYVAAAFEDPDLDAVYGDLEYVDRKKPDLVVRRWKSSDFRPGMLARGWMPPHPTLYVRKKWYELLGGFDSHFKIAADYAWILRLFSQSELRAQYLPHSLVRMSTGGISNRSLRNIVLKSREDLTALRRSGVGGFGALLGKNFSKIGQLL